MRRALLAAAAGLAAACAPDAPDCGPEGCGEPDAPSLSYEITVLETPSQASFRGLSVVSDTTVWAGGDGGVLMRTTDAGETWRVFEPELAAGEGLRSVHAFSADHVLAVTAGQPARIIVSRDGGESFQLAHEDPSPDAFYDSIAFWDDQRGLAFSDPVDGVFRILLTGDGGRSWRLVPPEVLPAPLPGEAGFAASGAMTITGEGGRAWIGTGGAVTARVLRTEDYGSSWDVSDTPLRAGLPSAGVFGLLADRDRIIALGGDYIEDESSDRVAAWSEDGGVSWTLAERQPHGLMESAIRLPRRTADDAPGFLAIGPQGDSVSVDGGRNWEASTPGLPLGLHAIRMSPSGRTAYAVGADGQAVRYDFNGSE